MIDNKDYKFIKEKFESDGLQAPESLSADSIMQKLNSAPQEDQAMATVERKTRSLHRRRWFRPVISIAACAALVIGLVPLMNSFHTVKMSEGLLEFSSYSELNSHVKDMIPDQTDHLGVIGNQYGAGSNDLGTVEGGDVIVEDAEEPNADFAEEPNAAVPSEAPENDLGATQGSAKASETPDHSETYAQVEGIDEADIVKTDGNYIYFTSYVENQVIIVKAEDGKTERVGAINASKIGSGISDMYVKDGRLIVIGGNSPYWTGYNSGYIGEDIDLPDDADAYTPDKWNRFYDQGRNVTTVTVFDVSDPSKPKQQCQYSQTGALLSSRMTGDKVILVTNDMIYSYKRNYVIPYVCYDEKDPVRVDIDDICGIPKASEPSYTVIGSIDTSSGKSNKDTVKTKAVLGGSSEIYCNSENLYITADVAEERETEDPAGFPFYAHDYKTCILKVSISDGKVNYKKTATVDGSVNNQFSMDEAGGYFKIAVTEQADGTDTNSLYVFDKNMKEVGSVRNFAPDEHIESVRYIKDKAYVITYKQTDPLFIIDLKDPSNPVIEGHVKITGFSTLLVPTDKDHLLGFGFSTEETGSGEATDGVKLTLFNVSNPSKPTVADFTEFTGMSSEVQYNHKALLVGPKASYYAIPYTEYIDHSDEVIISEPGDVTIDDAEEPLADIDDYTEPEVKNGVLVFSVKSDNLSMMNKYRTKESVKRCIYIGDYIYNICDDDSIESFKHLAD